MIQRLLIVAFVLSLSINSPSIAQGISYPQATTTNCTYFTPAKSVYQHVRGGDWRDKVLEVHVPVAFSFSLPKNRCEIFGKARAENMIGDYSSEIYATYEAFDEEVEAYLSKEKGSQIGAPIRKTSRGSIWVAGNIFDNDMGISSYLSCYCDEEQSIKEHAESDLSILQDKFKQICSYKDMRSDKDEVASAHNFDEAKVYYADTKIYNYLGRALSKFEDQFSIYVPKNGVPKFPGTESMTSLNEICQHVENYTGGIEESIDTPEPVKPPIIMMAEDTSAELAKRAKQEQAASQRRFEQRQREAEARRQKMNADIARRKRELERKESELDTFCRKIRENPASTAKCA